MSTRRFALVALLALPFVLAGCKVNTINSFPTKPAHVRVVNVVEGSTTIDVTADGASTYPGVAFETSSAFVDLDNKNTTFTATLTGASSQLISTSFSLAGDQGYTLIVFGTTTAPQLVLLPDATTEPGSGRTQLRVSNNGIGIGTVDVYITPPGLAIDQIGPNLAGIGYTGATTYLQFSPGTYEVRITGSGTKVVFYDSGPITLSDNTATDLIAYVRGSGTLMNALMLDVNGAAQQRRADSTVANIRFMHAAPQAGNINALVDGTALFTGVAYGSPTGFATITPGAHTVTFEATATPGVPLATVTPTIGPATDTTVVLSGLAGSTHAFVLTDNNSPPLPGNTRVRFLNATIGAGAFDVLVNNTKVVSALAPDTASPYIELGAGTDTVVFADPATGVARVTLSGLGLLDTETNTIFIIGTPDALQGGLVRDD
jgi:Domain of unknown function (DUF4397)